MSTTPEQLIELSPQAKRDLLAQLLSEQEKQRAQKNAPLKDEWPQLVPDRQHRYEPFPLTDIQQAYWLGRSAAFDLGGVGIHGYFELDCFDLDLERLNAAWQRVVERHDMMRAIILPEGAQRIQETVPPYQFEMLDLRGQPPEAVRAQLEEIRQRMSHKVYDPERWPLFEIRASRLDDRLTRLHFSEDALHADMMSTAIILDDWLRLYENPDLDLPAPALSFRDYVLALERVKESDVYRRSMDYWRKRIETLPGGPDLPMTTSPGALAQTRFNRRSMTLEPDKWSRLKELAANRGITSSSLLMAIYAEVLAAWSSNTRFCINVTIYNRLPLHAQVAQIAGDFTSMVFLEVDRRTPATFAERAKQLQKQLWNDLEYRHVSGVEVLRELARHQGQGPKAMMPVVFTGTLGTPGYRSLVKLGNLAYCVTQTPQVILDQQVFEEEGAMCLSWDAVEDLFPTGVLDEMFAAYSSALSQLALDEDCWDGGGNLIPVTQPCIHPSEDRTVPKITLSELFAQQVVRRSHEPAVITSGRTLSYKDLDHQSNHVAKRLQSEGVGRGVLAAIVMEKGWEQIVGVLGILKAGAAYVPIDPQLPDARRFELLFGAEVEVVLTQPHLVSDLKWPEGVRLAALKWEDEPEGEVEAIGDSGWDDLAYVIYTSGSTGLSKGVMIDHRNIVNRMVDVVERFGITSEDRALALTALHHDLSVFDIFGMLAVAGGALVIPDPNSSLDPSHWLELIGRNRVTIWNSVPAFMQMLVETLAGEVPSVANWLGSLRLVLLSGDWIPVDLPDRIREASAVGQAPQIISLGGPTETTVWDICYPVDRVDSNWTSIPYGRPMTNSRYYVLKDNLDLCPTWVTGELCIAGAGLSRGYWRDPDKTHKSFIAHPQNGERLYRSGDLGRYLPDGNIEILGRKDFQVKIRGNRIELGEIESILKQHPQVNNALATVLEGPEGLKQLVAYVVLRDEGLPGKTSCAAVEVAALSSNGANGRDTKAIAKLDFQLQQHALRDEPERSRVMLVKPQLTEAFLESHMLRKSHRQFLQQPLSLAQFSEFMSCLMQVEQENSIWPKYRYPSAANLYPVQIYLYVKRGCVEGIPAGIYYYHPVEHDLVLLSPDAIIDGRVHGQENRQIFEDSAFSIFLVGRTNAIEPLYPEQARDFCLLEAGYISQLMMTFAPASQIGLCPIGGLDFDQIRSLFDIGDDHLLLHSLCGGLSYQIDEPSVVSVNGDHHTTTEGDITQDLQLFLSARIPQYMIPQHIVRLDSLPLNSNGKINRKALPLPRASATSSHLAPETDLERLIAEVWQDVLKVDSLSTNISFFELGASSIHMVQVRARLQALTGKRFSIVDLFRHPTISSLARCIDSPHGDQTLLDESSSRAETRKSLRRRRPVKD